MCGATGAKAAVATGRHRAGYAARVSAGSYESWFLSARDPASARALWIRHTRVRGRGGPQTAALWCTVADPRLGASPVLVKQVRETFPDGAVAGPREFRGTAALGGCTASWQLAIASREEPLHPLRPALLERAPLPRTKLVASVPDGLVSGTLAVAGHRITVNGWRGTAGRNWGREHADAWVWLHADSFATAPGDWLELVLARVRLAGTRLPWTAMGTLRVGGERIPLGGLGRRVQASPQPGRLTATIAAAGGRLAVTVTASEQHAAAVRYTAPAGGSRSVRHATMAAVGLRLRGGRRDGLALTTRRGAYEYGTSDGLDGITLAALPEG